MAKSDINRTGKYSPKRREISRINCEIYEKNSRDLSRKEGPKQKILNAYRERNNKKDAYEELKRLNEGIGIKAFSKEIVDEWIEEEDKKSRTDEDFTR